MGAEEACLRTACKGNSDSFTGNDVPLSINIATAGSCGSVSGGSTAKSFAFFVPMSASPCLYDHSDCTVPPEETNEPATPSPSTKPIPASMGHIFPPPLPLKIDYPTFRMGGRELTGDAVQCGRIGSEVSEIVLPVGMLAAARRDGDPCVGFISSVD